VHYTLLSFVFAVVLIFPFLFITSNQFGFFFL